MNITIEKQSFYKTNKILSFTKESILKRIYFKNKFLDKNFDNIYFFEKDKTNFKITNQKKELIFYDEISKINYVLKKIENSVIFFKNKDLILILDIFQKTPRSEALYKYETNKIIDFESFLFLQENELEDFNIVDIYNLIEKNLNIKDLYKYNSIFNYVNNIGLKKLINKISFLNKELDLNFLQSFKPAWSEVFKLHENRNNRKIVAIDVNSMFPYCMNQENFSQINKLKHLSFENEKASFEFFNKIKNKEINNGISIVKLKLKENLSIEDKKFIEDYNYFQINFKGNFYFFNGFVDNEITLCIHNSEIQVLYKYFNFSILESIFSDDSISHYLANTTDKLYDLRINAKNPIEKKVIKTMLVAYHSTTNKNQMQKITKTFQDKKEAIDYFVNYLKLGFLDNWLEIKRNVGKRLKDIFIKDIKYNKNKSITILFNIPYVMDTTQIYSLPSQIMANSRIVIFNFLEKIKEFNKLHNTNIEPCYTNIDSIHLSIPINDLNIFKEYFKEDIDEKVLGKFKIEGIFDTGIWFDPGRYWLLNKKDKNRYEVPMHKSSVFKDNDNNWVVYKDIFRKDKFGSMLRIRHNIFYSTGYNKILFNSSKTNIICKKINISKIISKDFLDFSQKIIG